jgi:hypothetical protein
MKEILVVPPWLVHRHLPDSVSLQILDGDQKVIFSDSGKWLHPLLAAEEFLVQSNYDVTSLVLHDRIAGRAAAALTTRMGFKIVKASLMSQLAISLYDAYQIAYHADQLVERIACQTEELIDVTMDLDMIHAMILLRATS